MTGLSAIDSMIGRQGWVEVSDTLAMAVTIIDTRRVFGRTEYQIVPTVDRGGEGQTWIKTHTFKPFAGRR